MRTHLQGARQSSKRASEGVQADFRPQLASSCFLLCTFSDRLYHCMIAMPATRMSKKPPMMIRINSHCCERREAHQCSRVQRASNGQSQRVRACTDQPRASSLLVATLHCSCACACATDIHDEALLV